MPDEMKTDEFARLWCDIATLRPEKLTFTGGEPLLRSDLLALLAGMRDADPEHHVQRCLNSNGQLVTRELARELVGLVDEVRVSVDALRNRNDSLRGSGSFDAAISALHAFYSVGFEPKALVTVTARTLPDLEQLISLLLQSGIRRININRFRPIGRGAGQEDWQVDSRAIGEAISSALSKSSASIAPSEVTGEEFQSTCGVGQFLNIMPNGDVFPCHVLTQPEFRCGNIRAQSLVDICGRHSLLGSLAALNFEELAEQDESLVGLTETGTCMGVVFSETSRSSVWRRSVPLLQIQH
jgi:MoaA/NifB/PqqE/SkfB family radical SAM enzyme